MFLDRGDGHEARSRNTVMMDLYGKKILVVGLARTGVAVTGFLKARGSIVSATEVKGREEADREVARRMEEMGIPVEWGGHREETFLGQDLIVVSPGVDLAIEPIRKAKEKGVPVLSEIELAFRFIHVPIIAVTGTN
jgi:UDP-N-acetylmuramoylalanine--D-glutamate ligase